MPFIVVARHASTIYNERRLVSGDPGNDACVLSPTGMRQARSLGRELSSVAFDLCVTSEFIRARQTADLALAGRDVPRLELGDLNELAVGEFEGMPVTDFDAWINENGGPSAVPPGGESWGQALNRWRCAFELLAVLPEERVLVIAHGTPIAILLRACGRKRADDGGVENAVAHRVSRQELIAAIPNLAL